MMNWKIAGLFCILLASGLPGQEYKNYNRIDAYADQAPSRVSEDIRLLADYLVQPASNDFEKIRSLFRWVTQNIEYDVESYFTRDHKRRTPEQILQQKMAVCDGYANLLAALGEKAGLEAAVIYGYSKGYGYATGDAFAKGSNHAWNAVKINHRWYLLDATWGAGYIDERKGFVAKFQEYYFLTPAEKFIYDHFPEEERWQLTDRTLTLTEFQKLPNLRPAFFEYGLSLKSHQENTIRTDQDLRVDVYAPDDVSVIGQLEQEGNALPDYLNFSQRKGGVYSLFAQFPHAGTYDLKIFVKANQESGDYQYATEYKVEAGRGLNSAGFPATFAAFYETHTYLFEPMKRWLSAGKQEFKISVPRASEVAIQNNDQWHILSKQGQQFEGQVELQNGKVMVYAKFNQDSPFSGLLEWVCK